MLVHIGMPSYKVLMRVYGREFSFFICCSGKPKKRVHKLVVDSANTKLKSLDYLYVYYKLYIRV